MFNDVVLKYKGGEYTISSDRVMKLIEVVENHVTLMELTRSTGAPLAKTAAAYSAALNFAGARTTSEEVYAVLFSDKGANIPAIVAGLISICVPPQEVAQVGSEKKRKGKNSVTGT